MRDIPLFLLGVAIAWLTLRDVFDTVVVPGGSRASLQVTRRGGRALLTLWKGVRRTRHGITFSFAPLVLVSSFIVWMSLLALAFGLMSYAARAHFVIADELNKAAERGEIQRNSLGLCPLV